MKTFNVPWLPAFPNAICSVFCILHSNHTFLNPYLSSHAIEIYSEIRSRPFPSKSWFLRCVLCGIDRFVSTGLVGLEVLKIGGLLDSYEPAIILFVTSLADCWGLGTISGGYVSAS